MYLTFTFKVEFVTVIHYLPGMTTILSFLAIARFSLDSPICTLSFARRSLRSYVVHIVGF